MRDDLYSYRGQEEAVTRDLPPADSLGNGGDQSGFQAVFDASDKNSLVIDQGLLLLTAQFVRSGPSAAAGPGR